jgi:quercetin dioxygenase-like cupin family protein
MKGELDSKILVNRPDKQIVLTTIHENTEINSFQSDDSVTLKVIGGKLKLHTRKESIILDKGQLHRLHKNMIYNLTTEEETMFLLIIIKAAILPPGKETRIVNGCD